MRVEMTFSVVSLENCNFRRIVDYDLYIGIEHASISISQKHGAPRNIVYSDISSHKY